ncbi:family 14 glycosylhydrolase [Paenibacillus sp. 2TAB23]|uniref:family 14 glycosylhydrolase n=1 Tax=Paenibacillus sp. 2TAB23 TaxID=3233004 RepID=UPI003F94492F
MNARKTIWRKVRLFLLSAVMFLSTFFGSFTGAASANVANDFQASVMAPLTKITDWNAFKNQLITLKNNGVYALTTDIWWGDVEAAGDNQFDWSYYKTYANAVIESGLKWVPILSTHTCGGNPGDDCNIPIPSWLWSKGTADEMKYKSESGYVNNEALSPFWSGISTQYTELYASFAQNFASYKPVISKIYLSAGPSGELRYPSYYNSAGWSYPSRGKFQVYTDTAKAAFRTAMTTKYGSLTGVNQAWGLQLTNVSQINPPSDGDSFYATGGYQSNYGKDFLAWNQSVLENHLGVIGAAAHSQLDSTFGVRIGAKISGIHWQMNNPSAPHSAEHAAGYYNYNGIIQKFKDSDLDLTFTALEMYDSGTAPAYSQPSTLVDTVSSIANVKGVRLNGENALPTGSFQKIEEQIMKWSYNGFTLLRLANVVNQDGSPTGNLAGFKQYVINHAGPIVQPGDNQVTIYYKKGYASPYIHYRPTGGTWTTAPGQPMPNSEISGYSKITIEIGAAIQLEAVFNNGSGTWDSNNMQNYLFNEGVFTYTPSTNGTAGMITAGAPQGIDTTAPSIPANLVSTGKTDSSISLAWSASTDTVGVTGYEIWREGVKVGTTSGTVYTQTGLSSSTVYSFTVKAFDAAGNTSDASAALSVSTNAAPSTNTVTVYYKKGFATPYIHYRPVGGTWSTVPGTAMPNAEISGYAKLTLNIGTATQLEACFNNGSGTWDSNQSQNYLFSTGTWTYTPGVSGAAGMITAGPTQNPDTTAPSAPNSLAVTGKTDSAVTLSWTASNDTVGVTGYELWRNGVKVAATPSTSYTHTGLIAATAYSFSVRAYDAAGNVSDASNVISETTNPAAAGNSVTIYYKKGYATPYIHYRPAGGAWTAVPGKPMTDSEVSGYAKITIALGTATQLEAVFNNGSGTWDNNNAQNYRFNAGLNVFIPSTNGTPGSISQPAEFPPANTGGGSPLSTAEANEAIAVNRLNHVCEFTCRIHFQWK